MAKIMAEIDSKVSMQPGFAIARISEGKKPHSFIALKFDLGEAIQFDWSEEGLVVGGIYRRIQVFHMKLCASRAFWLVAKAVRPKYNQPSVKQEPTEVTTQEISHA